MAAVSTQCHKFGMMHQVRKLSTKKQSFRNKDSQAGAWGVGKNSLDDVSEAECKGLWLEEAKRRYKEYKAGNIKGLPAKDVFRDAHARLREVR